MGHDEAMSPEPEHAPSTATVSVLFCDLVGSTERQTRLGDDASDVFRRRYYAALRAVVARTRGEEVKNTGDGLMVVYRNSVLDAVACGVAMHEAVAAIDADPPAQIYVGISLGEAAEDDNDWFGTPVNEAARLCAAAKPGQTLASEVVRGVVGTRGGYTFRSVGSLDLKGLPGPVAAVEVLAPAHADDAPAEPSTARGARGRNVALAAAAIITAVVVVAALLVFGRGSGSNATSPSTPSAGTLPRDYPVSYAPAPCPPDQAGQIVGLTCGTLTVPENRQDPHGRVVKLSVYRAPARGHAASDPVLDFGADDLATSAARDHAEEIQLADRGWGGTPKSDPALTCPGVSKIAIDALAKPSDDPASQAQEDAALHACYEHWRSTGVDLDTYNYVTEGDDMVDLIRALHLSHVNLVSGYLASISALEVIRQLPGSVRSLTLQEPVAPGRSGVTNPTQYLAGGFESYVALCRANPSCNASFPNLPASLKAFFDASSAHPTLVAGDDGDGHRHLVYLDAGHGAQALLDALSNSDTFGLIAAVIGSPVRGGVVDTATASRVVHNNEYLWDPNYAWGMQLSNGCSYDLYTIDAVGSDVSRRTVPELAGVDNGFLQRACKVWPVHKIPDVAFDDPATTVPTLIVTPNIQPGGDPAWADTFRRGLPNATVLKFATLDRTVLASGTPPCLATLRRAFLADPSKPIDGTACERQSPPINFLSSLTG